MESSSGLEDRIERPHIVWWVVVIGGIILFALWALSTPFYEWYQSTVHPLPSQTLVGWMLIALLPIHTFEAVYVVRLARKLGLVESAPLWGLQTLILGYPSTKLMLDRARSQSA